MQVIKRKIGNVGGKDVFSLDLLNDNLKVSVSTFGAIITAVHMPDKTGNRSNVVLNYSSLEEYIKDPFYLGCTAGRFAGRISKGKFTIDEKTYQLHRNDSSTGNHLHGGLDGFNRKVFSLMDQSCTDTSAKVCLHLKSPDMDQGYPGNLNVWVTFELNVDNSLLIRYEASTDAPTHVNLTNHSYFNLNGLPGKALKQKLFINADKCLKTDQNYIPTGETQEVKGTINDFSSLKEISAAPAAGHPGYNVCYVLKTGKQLADAILFDEQTGRRMEVITSLPGMVFYSGNFLDGIFNKSAGICLETQYFPDTPNRPEFPDTLLRPEGRYDHYTLYRFSWG